MGMRVKTCFNPAEIFMFRLKGEEERALRFQIGSLKHGENMRCEGLIFQFGRSKGRGGSRNFHAKPPRTLRGMGLSYEPRPVGLGWYE